MVGFAISTSFSAPLASCFNDSVDMGLLSIGVLCVVISSASEALSFVLLDRLLRKTKMPPLVVLYQ